MTDDEAKNLARQEPPTVSSSSTDGDTESAAVSSENNTDQKFVKVTHEELFSGPLPPPKILAQFNEIQSDFAERIVSMAEKQALHRQAIEGQMLEAQIGDDKRQRCETFIGQFFGFIITLAIITIAAISIYLNPTWPVMAFSSLVGGGGIVGLVYAFRYTKQADKADKKNKTESE